MLSFTNELYGMDVTFVPGRWNLIDAHFEAAKSIPHIEADMKRESAAYRAVMDAFSFHMQDHIMTLSLNMHRAAEGKSPAIFGKTPREAVLYELKNFVNMRGEFYFVSRALSQMLRESDQWLAELAAWNGGIS